MTTRKLLVGEVSLEDLLERLSFTEETVQQAAMEQAKLFQAAATYRIKKMKTRQEAEARYDDTRISRGIKIRTAGEKKTEKHLTDLIDRDPDVRAARDKLYEAKRLEEYSKLLLDAYEHRRSAIKVIAQFAYVEDGMAKVGGAEKLRSTSDRLRKQFPERYDDED